jgi:ParB/RepB/Spo0J family partition protein
MTATAETQVLHVALERLVAAPWNARQTFDTAQLDELAASIRAVGVQTPLLVRWLATPEAAKDGRQFEIVAGHRRARAAKLAGRDVVPCIVRELTDAEARELGVIDNLQREDVSALEEAEAFGALYDLQGSIQAVAARVSKNEAYVAKRLKLRTLSLAGQDALRERLITVDHALLLARLGAEEQDAALKWALDPQAGVKTSVEAVLAERLERRRQESAERTTWRYKWEPESAQRLKEHIERESGRKLSRAPWDLEDADLLPDVGACSSCPSNTKANTALFADLAIEEATCADGVCFEAKREEYVVRRVEASRGGDGTPRILMLSWKSSSVKPSTIYNDLKTPGCMTTTANSLKTLRQGQWVEAKKGSCPNVRTGITVDWNDDASRGYMGSGEKLRKPGEALQVCIAVGCKVHPKAYEKKESGAGSRKRDEAAEKAAREKRKAEAIEESKLRMAVASKALDGVTTVPEEVIRSLALEAAPNWGEELKAAQALLPEFMKRLKTAKVDSAEFAKAVALASLDELTANEWLEPPQGRKEFLASIKRLGHDGAAAWSKPAKKAKKATAKPAKKAPAKKVGKLSPEARKRIAAGVKKRWAQQNAAKVDAHVFDDPGGGDS